jgi:hypothetical protein
MEDTKLILREYTLRAISDDYENFDKVVNDVLQWAAKGDIAADRSTIAAALEQLIRLGYAQAYFLSAGPPAKIEVASYSTDGLNELWFYVTPKGKRLAEELGTHW